MEKIRILIADDERPAREFLRSLLAELDDVEVVGEAKDGAEALELIEALEPDLALLDLQMPEMSGMTVVELLPPDRMPLVAFVTAFDDKAIAAFELNAVDYLLKPVEPERLRATIARAAARLRSHGAEEDSRDIVTQTRDEATAAEHVEPIRRIPVKDRDEIYLIPVEEIASVIADGELLKITTIDNRRYTINFRLKDLEARLEPERFIRLSRGALVNLDAVSHIVAASGGTYIVSLATGQEVVTSRQRSKILREQLLRL